MPARLSASLSAHTCLAAWVAAVMLAATPAAAQQTLREGIAVVVNDEIISNSDVVARIRMAIAGANLPSTPETFRQVEENVLPALVEDKLRIQLAKESGIQVTESEIDEGFAQVAQQNGLSALQFEQVLGQRGVPVSALRDQIEAEISWGMMVRRRLRPTISISEDEIDRELAQLRANAGRSQFLTSEIYLPVVNPADDERVRAFAADLVDQVRAGTEFSALARQFSQAAGAANGGDIGWVREGQLQDEIDRVLVTMRPGQVSAPIRGLTGYHILLVRDQRQILGAPADSGTVFLKQYLVGLPPEPTADQLDAAGEEALGISGSVEGCEAMDAAIAASGSELSGDLGEVEVGDLPEPIRVAIQGLPVGRATQPLRGPSGIAVLMVCDRSAPETDLAMPPRDEIRNALGVRQLERIAERTLRDFRASSLIEYRR